MQGSKFIEEEAAYGAHNYHPLPLVLVRGKGVYVWDEKGARYLDMMSAYSALNYGHCHPKLVAALKKQAETLAVVSRAFYSDQLGPFLKRLSEVSGFARALPMNTGAEAVETALKAARKWAYTVKGVAEGQAEIIACAGNFHGRTIAIVGMSSVVQYRFGFGPFPAGFKTVPYGDIQALEQAITPQTAAFIVEPIQGEGGIIVPPAAYLKASAALCKKHHVLMICDEVQTGLGRTGQLFAYQHAGIKPDAITLGKSLGGGLVASSAFLSSQEIMEVFTPGDHGSTFGGNPLAAAVGHAALDLLLQENLIERAAKLGTYFKEKLLALNAASIKSVRGQGLLLGLELAPHFPAREFCLNLLKEGVLTKETHGNTVRLVPPLIISQDQLDDALRAIEKVAMTQRG